MNTRNQTISKGVTLIELLTVISIMVVLLALMIPQLRMVTKDRSAREAARIVGTTFNDASSQARFAGFAGLAIARNANVVREDSTGTNQIHYAGYSMFQLRQPPSYIGNTVDEIATVAIVRVQDRFAAIPADRTGQFTLTLANPPFVTIDEGFVRLNSSKAMYRIVNSAGAVLTCEVPLHLEMPAAGTAGVPFEVIREPVLRQTSQIDLPKGHMINLNYSGPIDFADVDGEGWTWTAFSQVAPGAEQEAIYIIFDDQGGIDRIYPNGLSGTAFIPNGSVHFCISTDEVKHSFQPTALSDAMLLDPPTDVLDEPTLMWISINHINGSVVVTDSTPPSMTNYVVSDTAPGNAAILGGKKGLRILEALEITGKRQAATQ